MQALYNAILIAPAEYEKSAIAVLEQFRQGNIEKALLLSILIATNTVESSPNFSEKCADFAAFCVDEAVKQGKTHQVVAAIVSAYGDKYQADESTVDQAIYIATTGIHDGMSLDNALEFSKEYIISNSRAQS